MATWIGISPFRKVSPHPHFIHSQYCSDGHYISNPCLNLFLNILSGKIMNIWPELTQRSVSWTWGSLPGPGTAEMFARPNQTKCNTQEEPWVPGFSILWPLGKLEANIFDKGILWPWVWAPLPRWHLVAVSCCPSPNEPYTSALSLN